MVVTNVDVKPVESTNTYFHGFANVTFDNDIKVNGFRIIEGRNGYFVSPPQDTYTDKKTGETKFSDSIVISSNNLKKEVTNKVLTEYENLTGKKVLGEDQETENETMTAPEEKNVAPAHSFSR